MKGSYLRKGTGIFCSVVGAALLYQSHRDYEPTRITSPAVHSARALEAETLADIENTARLLRLQQESGVLPVDQNYVLLLEEHSANVRRALGVAYALDQDLEFIRQKGIYQNMATDSQRPLWPALAALVSGMVLVTPRKRDETTQEVVRQHELSTI